MYLGTDKKHLNKSISLVERELRKLKEIRLGTMQLHKAKLQIKGQVAMSYENHSGMMLGIGKSLMVFDKVDSREDIFRTWVPCCRHVGFPKRYIQ